jgi:hypothetical protein
MMTSFVYTIRFPPRGACLAPAPLPLLLLSVCLNESLNRKDVIDMRRLLVLPALAIVLVSSCRGPEPLPLSTDTAEIKKPLIGAMDLDFYFDNPIWRGPISGDINGWIEFTSVEGYGQGGAWHFAETWQIKEYNPVTEEVGPVLLEGTDAGVVSPNSEYRMNGVVTHATGDWTRVIGRNIHASGKITWIGDDPETAPGTFRIN